MSLFSTSSTARFFQAFSTHTQHAENYITLLGIGSVQGVSVVAAPSAFVPSAFVTSAMPVLAMIDGFSRLAQGLSTLTLPTDLPKTGLWHVTKSLPVLICSFFTAPLGFAITNTLELFLDDTLREMIHEETQEERKANESNFPIDLKRVLLSF